MKARTALLYTTFAACAGAAVVHTQVRPLSELLEAGLAGRIAPAAAAPVVQAEAPVKVETEAIAQGRIAREIVAVGTLLSSQSVVIRPEIAGRVSRMHFEDGQEVQEGQALLTLDENLLRAELVQAEATLESVRINADRAETLVDRGAGTLRARDEAQAALRSVEAAVDLAHERLARTRISAPFEGTVGLQRVEVGDYVDPGQDIVNLEDIEPLKADFRVPERFLGSIAVGQPVALRTVAHPDRTFAAEISALDPLVDAAGRSLLVRALVPNDDRALRPGQFVAVSIPIETREDALLVSENAIVPEGDGHFVWRVVDGKATRTRVGIGLREDGRAEVSGIAAGEVVVVMGHEKLREGAAVEDARVSASGTAMPAAARGALRRPG